MKLSISVFAVPMVALLGAAMVVGLLTSSRTVPALSLFRPREDTKAWWTIVLWAKPARAFLGATAMAILGYWGVIEEHASAALLGAIVGYSLARWHYSNEVPRKARL